MWNRWDPDQVRRFVGPDRGQICMQMLWAADNSRQWGENYMKSLSLYEPANGALFLGLSVRLSFCLSVRCWGHSNLHLLIGFLSDFIYGLLPSNSGSSLNTGFVRKRWPRWPTKWPPPISLHLWTLYISHLLPDLFQISYMDCFHQTLVQARICMGCYMRTLTKMADKMAAAYQFRCVVALT